MQSWVAAMSCTCQLHCWLIFYVIFLCNIYTHTQIMMEMILLCHVRMWNVQLWKSQAVEPSFLMELAVLFVVCILFVDAYVIWTTLEYKTIYEQLTKELHMCTVYAGSAVTILSDKKILGDNLRYLGQDHISSNDVIQRLQHHISYVS